MERKPEIPLHERFFARAFQSAAFKKNNMKN